MGEMCSPLTYVPLWRTVEGIRSGGPDEMGWGLDTDLAFISSHRALLFVCILPVLKTLDPRFAASSHWDCLGQTCGLLVCLCLCSFLLLCYYAVTW